jgi:hypothetical protein
MMVLLFPVLVLCAVIRDMTMVIGGIILAQGKTHQTTGSGIFSLFSSLPVDFITDTVSMQL